jgi:hypothetical protein
MRLRIVLAAAVTCAVHIPLATAGVLDPLKARVKPGLYDMTLQVEPVGEKPQSASMNTCVTPGNLEKGDLFGDAESGTHCEVKGFSMSGDSASYSVVCKGTPVLATDHKLTFAPGGFRAVSTTKSDGKAIMTTKAEAKYAGSCK